MDQQTFEVMASALSERGLISQEQIASDRAALFSGEPATETHTQPQSLAKEGDGVLPSGTSSLASTAPQEVDEISAAVMAPPETLDGYRFDPVPAGITFDIQQQAAFRAVCHASGIAAPIAAQVDRLWTQAIQDPPTPEHIEQARQQTHLQLNRAFGDDAGKVIEVAKKEFAAMVAKQPWLEEAAQVSGLANNFYVISSLYHNARAKGRA
jgi:hypothetical protein